MTIMVDVKELIWKITYGRCIVYGNVLVTAIDIVIVFNLVINVTNIIYKCFDVVVVLATDV